MLFQRIRSSVMWIDQEKMAAAISRPVSQDGRGRSPARAQLNYDDEHESASETSNISPILVAKPILFSWITKPPHSLVNQKGIISASWLPVPVNTNCPRCTGEYKTSIGEYNRSVLNRRYLELAIWSEVATLLYVLNNFNLFFYFLFSKWDWNGSCP